MAPIPVTPPRTALENRTNVHTPDLHTNGQSKPNRKRPLGDTNQHDTKRVKLTSDQDDEDSSETEGYSKMADIAVTRSSARKRTIFSMRNTVMMGHASALTRSLTFSTRSILQTFVSSHKADVFKCHYAEGSYFAVPYACAYSHDAKRGGTPLLAVATEEGAVHILNTSKRRDWDFEPQRTVISPHDNGIFDVKWSPSDILVATASGDQSTRITTLASSVSSGNRVLHVLRGHGSTIKCVAWDPTRNDDILCTGGRDGGICLWDLRVGEGRNRRMSGQNESNIVSETGALAPVIVIPGAHEVDGKLPKPKARKGKLAAPPFRSITSLIYPENDPACLVSSGSYDGILRRWDLRLPSESKSKSKTSKTPPKPICTSLIDPTTMQGTRRPRGITSLAPGTGATAGLLFALGTDSRVHSYALPSLDPLSGFQTGTGAEDPWAYSHSDMQSNSFYVRLALSPCGRWLASGSGADGRVFLYDVGSAASGRARFCDYVGENAEAVVLQGQTGEIGALDWGQGMFATCADDRTVRVWRPDVEVAMRCANDSESGWDWSCALNAK